MIRGPIVYTMDELRQQKAVASPEAVAELRRFAECELTKPTMKVIDRTQRAPTGDPHDYTSIGPYWWPNPDTPDGLPWINRDGYGNPAARNNVKIAAMYMNVGRMAVAAFYFDDIREACARRVNLQLYDWFLNPETYMKPHGKYAQSIPGRCEGRAAGLIDFRESYLIVNAIGILEEMGLADEKIVSGVREWFSEFTDFLLTHEIGVGEDNAGNNHGSWYDVQVLSSAIFCGREALAKKICKTAYRRRVLGSILPDGSQPLELKRTKAINYSLCNLEALLVVAAMATRLGYTEYWDVDPVRGECVLLSAINFIAPHAADPENSPLDELHPEGLRELAYPVFMSAAKHLPKTDYAARALALGVCDTVEPAF